MRVLSCGRERRLFRVLAFDGSARLAAADTGYPTVVWDIASGQEVVRLDDKRMHGYSSIAFRNGQLLTPTANGLVAYDPATGEGRTVLAEDWFVSHLAFDAKGDWGVLQHNGGTRSMWLMSFNRAGGPRQREGWSVCLNDPHLWQGRAASLACLPGGKRLLVAEALTSRHSGIPPFRVTIRAGSDGRVLAEKGYLWQSEAANWGWHRPVVGAPYTDTFVVVAGAKLRAYDARDLDAPPRDLRNDTKMAFADVAFHPSGKYLLAAGGMTAKLYDLRTGEVVRSVAWDIGRLTSAAFSPDGTLAAVGSEKGKAVVWDVDV